ncbi:MAG TPA: acetate kinase [Elusimicrobia bacterium]|nr:acetate kinase [Elusimicrobiota bacterium]
MEIKKDVTVLVFNCGSSSLTFKVFAATPAGDLKIVLTGKAHRVGVKGTQPSFIEFQQGSNNEKCEAPLQSHKAAALLTLEALKARGISINYIGHRWGHAGGSFKTAWVDKALLSKLKSLIPMMPIHHPAMYSVILQCRRTLPEIPQYITADGAFHSTIPPHIYTYPLPEDIVKRFGFRKFGFHGLSYQYVTGKAAEYLGVPLENTRIVACHLGTGGSSAVAVLNGKSLDTSMGYTGLGGLVMSTRSGDLDAMLAIYLMGVYGERSDDMVDMLNKKSGLLGVSRFSSDMRDIIAQLGNDPKAKLAFDMYVHRLKKYIGGYTAVLGGTDILIFTDDIGVHNWLLREKVCRDMGWCGVELDLQANRQATGDAISLLNSPNSKVKILAVPTEEELVICREGLRLAGEKYATSN